MIRLRWMRAFGDVIFAAGSVTFVLFVIGLSSGHSYAPAPARDLKESDCHVTVRPVRGYFLFLSDSASLAPRSMSSSA
jgi:hypothetical protein